MTRSAILVLFFCAGAAQAQSGAAFHSLKSVAASSQFKGSLESQSLQAGSPFTGAKGDGVATASSGESRTLPKANLGMHVHSPKPEPPKPPPLHENKKVLKRIRAGGTAAAVAGVGLFTYAVIALTTGPVGWASALIFFGGLSAYLAHRALKKL